MSHLRLLSFTGTVEFSDTGSLTGSVPSSDPAFRTAAAGGTDARVIRSQQGSDAGVRVTLPVIAGANGRAAGVLQVDLPYDAIATKVQGETHAEMVRFALSLVGLFAVLAFISWWTTRALRENAAAHEHQALHDSLTGLPNRQLFLRTAEDALARSQHGEPGALVLIDLDHFKEVNDTLGHKQATSCSKSWRADSARLYAPTTPWPVSVATSSAWSCPAQVAVRTRSRC